MVIIAEKEKLAKHIRLIERTYENNTNSDYTEKIEALGKSFDYKSNKDDYWGDPQFSMLYGTPLYEQATPSQKLALNHLYWVGQYNHTANSEANTILFNRITTGVFANIKGYEKLCEELNFETEQEYYHIKTFQRIGYKTKMALQGKTALGKSYLKKENNGSWWTKILPQTLREQLTTNWTSSESKTDSLWRSITKQIYKDKAQYYSQYLAERENEAIPTTIGGIAGYTASPSVFKFLALNWGSSPFMACQYYSARMVANMSLKTYEYQYVKHYRELTRQGAKIPIPTAVSYNHLLDESFHTTMSQTIAQEVYKDFPSPTNYEKLLSNLLILQIQRGIVGGLSGWLPATFRHDETFMPSLYRLLQSPLFEMSSEEALQWMEKCLCREHEGFYANVKHHENILTDFRRFFGRLDYLWAVNRDMNIMAKGGAIDKAIQNNIKAFERFTRSLDTENQ